MIIGVPREIKVEEYRVGVTPVGAAELVADGHTVMVETGAGEGSGFMDDEYQRSGARLCGREELFQESELIVKVKEPVEQEYDLLQEGRALFTFLHLAPNPGLTKVLLDKKIAGFAYETLESGGGLPLLRPMSEIAGRMAPLMAAFYLQRAVGGAGVLPTGVTGVKPARTVILGAGVAGTGAALVCQGMGLETIVLNRSEEGRARIDELFKGKVKTLPLTAEHIQDAIEFAEIVIGAILVTGGRTPVLITRDMLGILGRGSVLVDISVDQGGCFETTRPTTHAEPVYIVDGIVHYAVANMPGAYPNTATLALTNATLPYVRKLAGRGVEQAATGEGRLKTALNTWQGRIEHPGLAQDIKIN